MKKAYPLLDWLTSAQASQWIEDLTQESLTEESLLQLCGAGHCDVYITPLGCIEGHLGDGSDKKVRADGVQKLLNPEQFNYQRDQDGRFMVLFGTTFSAVELHHPRNAAAEWIAAAPVKAIQPAFKPADIRALAHKLNEHSGSAGESAQIEELCVATKQDRSTMEKFYRLLEWLNIEQTLDWLQTLTSTSITERELLQLCNEGHCDLYLYCSGVPGTARTSETPSELVDVTGNSYGRVDEPWALGEADYVSVVSDVCESDYAEILWFAFIPLSDRHPQFKPADVQALAAKMNSSEESLNASENKLKELHQQLQQERTRREAAENEVAELIQQLASLETATDETEEKPSHLRAIAALMELLKAPVEWPRPQGMNQAAIKMEILKQFPWRGLKDRNLDDIFAAANRAKKDT